MEANRNLNLVFGLFVDGVFTYLIKIVYHIFLYKKIYCNFLTWLKQHLKMLFSFSSYYFFCIFLLERSTYPSATALIFHPTCLFKIHKSPSESSNKDEDGGRLIQILQTGADYPRKRPACFSRVQLPMEHKTVSSICFNKLGNHSCKLITYLQIINFTNLTI